MPEQVTNQGSGAEQQGARAQSGGGAERRSSESRRSSLAKATQIVWLVTSILEVLIGIRVLLKLLGANPQAGFARFIYGITAVFLAPFTALFSNPSAAGAVLEISSLVAMLVYALIAWGIVRIMWVSLEEAPQRGGGPGAPA